MPPIPICFTEAEKIRRRNDLAGSRAPRPRNLVPGPVLCAPLPRGRSSIAHGPLTRRLPRSRILAVVPLGLSWSTAWRCGLHTPAESEAMVDAIGTGRKSHAPVVSHGFPTPTSTTSGRFFLSRGDTYGEFPMHEEASAMARTFEMDSTHGTDIDRATSGSSQAVYAPPTLRVPGLLRLLRHRERRCG